MDMLTHYEKIILEVFAKRFPKSPQRHGGRKIRIADWEKIIPEIQNCAEDKISFLDALEKLESRNVISVKWSRFRRGDEIEAVYLENATVLFELLSEDHPDVILSRILNPVRGKRGYSGTSLRIIAYCEKMMNEKTDLPFGDPLVLQDILSLIDQLEQCGLHLPLRALSVKLFSNSKRIEQLLPHLTALCKSIGGESAVESLKRSFPECMIKGNLVIEFSDGRIWRLCGEAVSFSLESAQKIIKITGSEPAMKKMVSIENKETFYHIDNPDLFCGYIFCHGHINDTVKSIVLTAHNSGNEMYHFGDMDPDGILIYNEINALCNGMLLPYCMDTALYEKYLAFGYDLNPVQLSRMPAAAAHLDSLITSINHYKKGVEQEIIDF